MRTLASGNQTTLGEHLEFSIFRCFFWVGPCCFSSHFSPHLTSLTLICRYLDSITAMQRALSSKTRSSILSSRSSYSSPLSKARQGGAITVGLQQQRFAHKVYQSYLLLYLPHNDIKISLAILGKRCIPSKVPEVMANLTVAGTQVRRRGQSISTQGCGNTFQSCSNNIGAEGSERPD